MADAAETPEPGEAGTGGIAGSAEVAMAAEAVFGDSLPVATKYARLLAGPGVERGVLGPAEAERIWDRHLLNSAAIARLVPSRSSVADIGSGAGLPGMVLAMLLPGVRVTLIEAMARRVSFLEECVSELGLANVDVVRGRAEDFAGHLVVDVVTARAVAPLDKLAGLCVGLLRPGGKVLAIKGASAETELVRARPVLARLGISDARVVAVGSADGVAAATVVMFSAPERRGADHRGQPGQRPAGHPGGRSYGPQRAAGPGGGRRARPNSRRGGG